jgi:hypothetical protein
MTEILHGHTTDDFHLLLTVIRDYLPVVYI